VKYYKGNWTLRIFDIRTWGCDSIRNFYSLSRCGNHSDAVPEYVNSLLLSDNSDYVRNGHICK